MPCVGNTAQQQRPTAGLHEQLCLPAWGQVGIWCSVGWPTELAVVLAESSNSEQQRIDGMRALCPLTVELAHGLQQTARVPSCAGVRCRMPSQRLALQLCGGNEACTRLSGEQVTIPKPKSEPCWVGFSARSVAGNHWIWGQGLLLVGGPQFYAQSCV